MVTLYLIVSLFEFDATSFEFYLHQGQTIDKNRYIITTFFATFHRDLIGNLKLILTPMLTVKKFHPNTLSVFCFQRK